MDLVIRNIRDWSWSLRNYFNAILEEQINDATLHLHLRCRRRFLKINNRQTAVSYAFDSIDVDHDFFRQAGTKTLEATLLKLDKTGFFVEKKSLERLEELLDSVCVNRLLRFSVFVSFPNDVAAKLPLQILKK